MSERRLPLYVLPHGLEVVGEYRPSKANRYWRVRLRPHPFFPDVKVKNGAIHVRRSRVVLASKIGGPIPDGMHVHHLDGDRSNDAPQNLAMVSPLAHNREHKLGGRHSEKAKKRISTGLSRAYREGRRIRPQITARDASGRIRRTR